MKVSFEITDQQHDYLITLRDLVLPDDLPETTWAEPYTEALAAEYGVEP